MTKEIFVWRHPKNLYNRYFFLVENSNQVDIRKSIYIGVLKLIVRLIFLEKDTYIFFNNLKFDFKLKNLLANFYALIFHSLGFAKKGKSIYVIGDIYNPIYMGLLISAKFKKNIDVWIVYQGTGKIKDKINFNYPKNVKKIFFPFSKKAKYENDLINNANQNRKFMKFYNIDSSLNIEIINSPKIIAIFQGYDKRKRLYPFYIFQIIIVLRKIKYLKCFNKFSKVIIYLHPRLSYLKILNQIKKNSNVIFSIYENNKKNKFFYLISYSPTVNSSVPIQIKNSKRFIGEIGKNFNESDIKQRVKKIDFKI